MYLDSSDEEADKFIDGTTLNTRDGDAYHVNAAANATQRQRHMNRQICIHVYVCRYVGRQVGR